MSIHLLSRISALTRKSAGVYTVTVTAGTDPETVTLTPSVSGITLPPAEVIISSITPDEARSAIKTDATTYVSGSDMTVTVTLKDASDNAVSWLVFSASEMLSRLPALSRSPDATLHASEFRSLSDSGWSLISVTEAPGIGQLSP